MAMGENRALKSEPYSPYSTSSSPSGDFRVRVKEIKLFPFTESSSPSVSAVLRVSSQRLSTKGIKFVLLLSLGCVSRCINTPFWREHFPHALWTKFYKVIYKMSWLKSGIQTYTFPTFVAHETDWWIKLDCNPHHMPWVATVKENIIKGISISNKMQPTLLAKRHHQSPTLKKIRHNLFFFFQ